MHPNNRLPHFVIIGAAKCGTTSFYHYLRQHPEIFMPARKEPSFFAHEGEVLDFKGPGDGEWKFVTDLKDYSGLYSSAPDSAVLGDISPRYLYFRSSVVRMAHYVPNARIITILRHPVDRAYSHFLMNRWRGCEPESDFVTAIAKEDERVERGWGWDWRYIGVGRYFEQLQRYFRLFPRERIKVFRYDDLLTQPETLFQDLFGFIGVNGSFRPDTSARHRLAAAPGNHAVQGVLRRVDALVPQIRQRIPASFPRKSAGKMIQAVKAWNTTSPTPLSPHTRDALFGRYFADEFGRLQELAELDLSHWAGGVKACL